MKIWRKEQDWEKGMRHFPIHPKGIPDSLKRKVEERIAMEKKPHRRRTRAWLGSLAIVAALVLLFLQYEPVMNWFKQEKTVTTETFDTTSERTLKVLTHHRDTFMRQYGNAFTIKYPNMSIIGVETMGMNLTQHKDPKAAYYELMEKEQLDVLYVPLQIYKEMAAEGRLYPLDTFVKQQKYDLGGFRPGVIDLLREAGGGNLYGLFPTFNSQAIYYNKDLFERYAIPYPTDQMSWEELLRLAARFPADGTGDNRIYGFVSNSSATYNTAQTIAKTQRLSMTDAENKKLLVNTPSYRTIWGTVADGVKKGWINQTHRSMSGLSSSSIDWYKRNEFFTGNAAMIMSSHSLAYDLEEAKKRFNLASFAWDIVTEPVNQQNPDEASSYWIDGIFAINAKSSNLKDAWELIKLIHSEPMAQKNTASSFGSSTPSTFQNVVTKPKDARMEAFSNLKPSLATIMPAVLPQSFNAEMASIVNSEVKLYTQGTQSLDQTIEAIQAKGQAALDKANTQLK